MARTHMHMLMAALLCLPTSSGVKAGSVTTRFRAFDTLGVEWSQGVHGDAWSVQKKGTTVLLSERAGGYAAGWIPKQHGSRKAQTDDGCRWDANSMACGCARLTCPRCCPCHSPPAV
jgi:hypothetical protein